MKRPIYTTSLAQLLTYANTGAISRIIRPRHGGNQLAKPAQIQFPPGVSSESAGALEWDRPSRFHPSDELRLRGTGPPKLAHAQGDTDSRLPGISLNGLMIVSGRSLA